jgi:PIN domain nuclease of toxin-antitoxin system
VRIVLDTSTLIFWSLAPTSLSQPATITIANASQYVISSISLWEIGTKHRKGKLDLPGPFREFVQRIKQVGALQILAVDEDIWVASVELDWQHNDPADRVIVATAQMLNAPLIASDGAIRAFYPQSVW